MNQIRFTKEGYEKLKKQREDLLKSRPEAVQELKKARDMGDLSENGYYKAARGKLSSIDGNLERLKILLKQAIIMENSDNNLAEIGKTIIVSDGQKDISYQLVGDLEADPHNGKISLLSPLGKALNGKREGENFDLQIPKGTIRYTIKKVG